MVSPSAAPGLMLQLRRTFPAPRQKVFEAWTDPAKLAAWFCHARPQFSGSVTEMDLRPGGRYGLEINETGGKVHRLRGKYQEVKPPEKLVFTWFWETEPHYGETVVTVELFDRSGQTELVLTQERFPTTQGRDEHQGGWVACFDALDKFLAS